MSSGWGKYLHFDLFGESHGTAIGVVIDGLPAGFRIDFVKLQQFLERRRPGRNNFSTARQERDAFEVLSGVKDGVTTGAPLAAIIRNGDAQSKAYEKLATIPRPGHADYTASIRYGGFNDLAGGGHFSGRLTAPLCIAGGIARQYLAEHGIFIGAHLYSVGCVKDRPFKCVDLDKDELLSAGEKSFPVLDDECGREMLQIIEQMRSEGDSVGGRIEVAAIGLPAGLGSPMFDGVENRVASIMFGIPAVRGIEFGYGMSAAELRGSQHNDVFVRTEQGVRTKTNNHGGALGGISSGMPLIVRIAVKPTPSIAMKQQTLDIATGELCSVNIAGRHDPCIAPRAVPVVEAALAVVLLDLLIEKQGVVI